MKTIYRRAAHAKRDIQMLPKWWQPKTPVEVKGEVKDTHWELIALFCSGNATRTDMWNWMEAGFTYTRMMTLFHEDGMEFTDEAQAALAAQLEIYGAISERMRRTGRVGFNGHELLIARAAAYVMDQLIDLDRHGIALKAAQWSEAQMVHIRRSAAAKGYAA